MLPETETLQLGALGIILVFSIKEFFSYLKAKKSSETSNGGSQVSTKDIVKELQLLNTNHMTDVVKCINETNCHLKDTIHDDNTKIIELLGEIKGALSVRNRE